MIGHCDDCGKLGRLVLSKVDQAIWLKDKDYKNIIPERHRCIQCDLKLLQNIKPDSGTVLKIKF